MVCIKIKSAFDSKEKTMLHQPILCKDVIKMYTEQFHLFLLNFPKEKAVLPQSD